MIGGYVFFVLMCTKCCFTINKGIVFFSMCCIIIFIILSVVIVFILN